MIFDYVDNEIPVTARMFKRRCLGYKAIGYEIDYGDKTHQISCSRSERFFRLSTS